MFQVPEKYRVLTGKLGSNASYGNTGQFELFIGKPGKKIKVLIIASCGFGWEHVSVSIPLAKRCPTWEEMCEVKSIFWSDDDCVIQFHPPKEDYVSLHNYCLHLWRPTDVEFPRPIKIMVG